jgi:enoyl-CoA hydratase/carnithine racemase
VAELVRLEVDGGIGTIWLQRPPMNALDTQMQDELAEVAKEAGERPEVAAVVVYGGPKVFAAGADIKQMQAMDYAAMVERSGHLQAAFTAVARIPKPTIAAITGYALGGGLELALACDFRVCGDNAKLGQPEILLGLVPGAGGTQRLPRLIGPARAKDLIFSGRFVEAAEALSLGLVDRVTPRTTSMAWRATWRRATSGARHLRSVQPRRRSTAASTLTSRPASRSNGCSSPGCLPPRTAPLEWPPSSSTGPARHASWALRHRWVPQAAVRTALWVTVTGGNIGQAANAGRIQCARQCRDQRRRSDHREHRRLRQARAGLTGRPALRPC